METDKLQLSSFPTAQISKRNVPKFSSDPGVVWGRGEGGEIKNIPAHQKRIHILFNRNPALSLPCEGNMIFGHVT